MRLILVRHGETVYNAQARFTGHANFDNALASTNSQIHGVDSWRVHNLTVGYGATSHLKLQVVVDNVFDRQAPFPLPAVPPNSTLVPIVDGVETYFSGILGRYFVASANYKF